MAKTALSAVCDQGRGSVYRQKDLKPPQRVLTALSEEKDLGDGKD